MLVGVIYVRYRYRFSIGLVIDIGFTIYYMYYFDSIDLS